MKIIHHKYKLTTNKSQTHRKTIHKMKTLNTAKAPGLHSIIIVAEFILLQYVQITKFIILAK